MSTPLPKDSAAKRAVLYADNATDEDRNVLADAFIERERFGEALEFLEQTRDPARLDRIREAAVDRGDTFLLLRVEQLRREPLSVDDWRSAARRALALEKFLDAHRALLLAGDEEQAESLRAERMPDYRPFLPDGK